MYTVCFLNQNMDDKNNMLSPMLLILTRKLSLLTQMIHNISSEDHNFKYHLSTI